RPSPAQPTAEPLTHQPATFCASWLGAPFHSALTLLRLAWPRAVCPQRCPPLSVPEGIFHAAGHLSAPKTRPQDPHRADPAFCGKTDPSSASEGGTPSELASTVFPR